MNAPLEQVLIMEKSVTLMATFVAAATIFPLLTSHHHHYDNGNTAAPNFIA